MSGVPKDHLRFVDLPGLIGLSIESYSQSGFITVKGLQNTIYKGKTHVGRSLKETSHKLLRLLSWWSHPRQA